MCGISYVNTIHLPVYLYIYLSIRPSICIRPSIRLSDHPFVPPSVRPSICPFIQWRETGKATNLQNRSIYFGLGFKQPFKKMFAVYAKQPLAEWSFNPSRVLFAKEKISDETINAIEVSPFDHVNRL